MALLPTKLISTEYILFGVGPECIWFLNINHRQDKRNNYKVWNSFA
jgi:hypothetical protein